MDARCVSCTRVRCAVRMGGCVCTQAGLAGGRQDPEVRNHLHRTWGKLTLFHETFLTLHWWLRMCKEMRRTAKLITSYTVSHHTHGDLNCVLCRKSLTGVAWTGLVFSWTCRFVHREHLFRVLAECPIWITFNTLSSGRSRSQCLECLVCLLGCMILLSKHLSSIFHSCVPLGANLESLERCWGQHSHRCLFFFLIIPATFRTYFMSLPSLSFFFVCFFAALPSLSPDSIFQLPFFFCLHGEVGGWVGADGGWRLGFLLTRLCGFITRRKGGNTMIHFTVSVWT